MHSRAFISATHSPAGAHLNCSRFDSASPRAWHTMTISPTRSRSPQLHFCNAVARDSLHVRRLVDKLVDNAGISPGKHHRFPQPSKGADQRAFRPRSKPGALPSQDFGAGFFCGAHKTPAHARDVGRSPTESDHSINGFFIKDSNKGPDFFGIALTGRCTLYKIESRARRALPGAMNAPTEHPCSWSGYVARADENRNPVRQEPN